MKNLIPLIALAPLLLSACVPLGVATGVGAAAGIASAQEGGLKSTVSDTGIKARINDYWFKYDVDMFSKLNLTVDQGRVLITGVVQKPEHRVEAVRLAWQAKGVKQVINEIQVGNTASVGSYATDKWITSNLRSQMVFNRDIQSINYTIDTVRGTVYLMGVAQNQKELDRVIAIARKIKGVKQVVSYVKMLGEAITSVSSGTAAGSVQQGGSGSTPNAPVVEAAPVDATYSNETSTSGAAPPSGIETEVLPP